MPPWANLATVWGVLFILWLVPSQFQLIKYLGVVGAPATAALAAAGTGALLWLTSHFRLAPSRIWFWLLCGLLAVVFVVIFPLANSGAYGVGSDRDDALNVTIEALLAGNYPYGVRTYLGNPPTPMPGAMVLALPFYLLGTAAWQNLFWMPVFVIWVYKRFASPSLALLALLMVWFSPAVMQDFATGGDYVVNAIYVAIAADLAVRTETRGGRWSRLVALLFLCLTISSRPIYAVVALVVGGQLLQTVGPLRALHFLMAAAAIGLALNLPFFLYDPAQFPTAHLMGKLDGQRLGIAAKVVLPIVAVLATLFSLRLKATSANLFAVIGLSLAAILYPAFLLEVGQTGHGDRWLWTATFAVAVSVFGTLAVLMKLDEHAMQEDQHQLV